MRLITTDLIIFLALFVVIFVVLIVTAEMTVIDIQLHDTYYVIDKTSAIVLILGPLTFLIFLARGLTTKFRSIPSNFGLMIGLLLVAAITFYVARLQENYLNEIISLGYAPLPDQDEILTRTKNKIIGIWALFGLWATGFLLLTIQTVKIWKFQPRAN